MPITLTTGFTLPNGMRLEFPGLVKGFDDDTGTWTVVVELRTSVPNGRRLICSVKFLISDGACQVLSRQPLPVAGLNIEDRNHYFVVGSRTVADGYTAAWAAVRAAANTPAARQAAAEAHLFSAGHIVGGAGPDSLAGT